MMKKCNGCNKKKPYRWFSKNLSRNDGYQTECKRCKSKYWKEHYNTKYKKKAIENTCKRRIGLHQLLYEYLSKHKCIDCGDNRLSVLEFDHLKDKKYNISKMVDNGNSWKTILKEIEKCEVVCANCHKIRTYTRINSLKIRFNPSIRQ